MYLHWDSQHAFTVKVKHETTFTGKHKTTIHLKVQNVWPCSLSKAAKLCVEGQKVFLKENTRQSTQKNLENLRRYWRKLLNWPRINACDKQNSGAIPDWKTKKENSLRK